MQKQGTLLKVNPPLRTDQDRLSLLSALRRGQIDMLATVHAPHTLKEKSTNIWAAPSGVPGLDTCGPFVTWLIRAQDISAVTIARMCSANAATFLGLHDRGSLAPGMRADLTLMSLHTPYRVAAGTLETKCGWSPFEGIEFPGSVRHVIRCGDLVVEDGVLRV